MWSRSLHVHISGLSEQGHSDQETIDIMYDVFSSFDQMSEEQSDANLPGACITLITCTYSVGAGHRFLCSLDISRCIMKVAEARFCCVDSTIVLCLSDL